MKVLLLSLCAALAGCAAQPQQQATGINPGLWETHVIDLNIGGGEGQVVLEELPQKLTRLRQAMVSMTPEQRRHMQALIDEAKAVFDPPGRDDSSVAMERWCISPAMAASDLKLVDYLAQVLPQEGHGCAPPRMQREGKRLTYGLSCQGQSGVAVTNQAELALTSDKVGIRGSALGTAGDRQLSIVWELQMTHISSDCGGIKPGATAAGAGRG